MSNTYYSSLSGMLAASYGLQNTSNNVANMQSHGFKRSDIFYSSLGNGRGEEGMGHGVRVSGSATNFSPGKYLETGTPTDLAVIGKGFFVIRLKSNELVYTRDGEFEFDHGVLIDKHSKGEVQGYDGAGNLVSIHEQGPLISPGKASRDIFLNGKFIAKIKKPTDTSTSPVPDPTPHTGPTTTESSQYENVTFKLDNIYDSKGKAHTLTLEFEPIRSSNGVDEGRDWRLRNIIYDNEQRYDYNEQIISFISYSAGAEEGKNSIKLILNDNQGININFGSTRNDKDHSVEHGELSTNPEGTKINIFQNDGYAEGKQMGYSFDENGKISYHYDNAQTIDGIHVGLARFDDMEHNLIQTQDNFFRARNNKGIHYGRPNEQGFEAIQPKQLELSNVDSTVEFANIVVLQRMFQACSQIMDIDKQLIEDLESKS